MNREFKMEPLFEPIYEVVCGMDIHKSTISAYILKKGERKAISSQFGTTTKDLRSLSAWLKSNACEVVAMESTGVYWKPILNILEENEEMEIMIVNAQHVKNVTGRKTDMCDAAWIAKLTMSGLVKSSLILPREKRELKDLTRYRKRLIEDTTCVINQMGKILQSCNIKLSSVTCKLDTKTGMNIINAIINNETYDPETLANMARGTLKNKKEELRDAIDGEVTEINRLLLKSLYDQLTFLKKKTEEIEEIIEKYMKQYEEKVEILKTIPGVGDVSAQSILSEIGGDVSRFAKADNLCSWAGLCPGNHESGGIRKSGKTTKGNSYLRAMLNECAWSAVKCKESDLSQFYYFKKRTIGKKKAIVATAHSMLRSIWYMLYNNEFYKPYRPPY